MAAPKTGLAAKASIVALLWATSDLTEAQAQARDIAREVGIEEVVVTARRVEENLQRVPVAVTAITADQLESRQIETVGDLAVPGLNFSPSGASQGRFYIRGIGGTNAITFDAGVGVYIDGVYVGRAQGSDFELLDLQRVEVLRGPQGTLFGRNTVGGAINLVSALPASELSGRAKVTFGRFDQLSGSAAVNLPLVQDVLTARVSFATNRRSGYSRDYVTGHRYDNEDNLGARAVFRWTPSEPLEFVLAADWSKQNVEGNGTQCLLVNPAAGALFLFDRASVAQGFGAFRSACVATTVRGIRNVNTGGRTAQFSFDGAEQTGGSLTATWSLSDSLALKSITAYRRLDSAQFDDVDAVPATLIEINRNTSNKQFSQELQAQGDFGSRLTYTTGFYYLKEITPRYDAIQIPAFLPTPQETFQRVERTSYAVYGQAVFSLTDELKITAGARYTWDEQGYEAFDRDQVSGALSNVVDPTSQKFTAFTHLLNASYQLTPDVMAYASWATGFKSGGFNTDNVPGFEPTFDPEHNDSYELGLKSILLDRRLQMNIAAYQSDYRDQQVMVQVFDPQSGAVSPLFQNAAKSRIRGVEVEVDARPVEQVRIGASYAYTHARYLAFDSRDVVTRQPISLTSRKMPHVPKHQFTLDAEWRVPLAGPLIDEIVLRSSYRMYSPVFLEITNDRTLRRDRRSSVDASISFVLDDPDVEIRFWGQNINNDVYVRRGDTFAGNFGFVDVSYSEPPTYGVTFSSRF